MNEERNDDQIHSEEGTPNHKLIKEEMLDRVDTAEPKFGRQMTFKQSNDARYSQSENMMMNFDSEIRSGPESTTLSNKLSEKQILEMAEGIFQQVAEKLIESKQTVREVFDKESMIHVFPSYDNVKNVVAITALKFMDSMYRLGFSNINQLQIQCVMRVVAKPDLRNAILLEDLVTLLENYGVPVGNKLSAIQVNPV